MKILDLVLTGKWYDMIDNGVKIEEYRDITPYWINRLCKKVTNSEIYLGNIKHVDIRHFDEVYFHRGYTKTTMSFKIKDITIGKGKTEWGAPDNREVFIIKLDKRL